MGDSFEDLIDRYGEDNVRKARWLQEKIREEGVEGIHFMEYAENQVTPYANLIVYQSVLSEMKKSLRRA